MNFNSSRVARSLSNVFVIVSIIGLGTLSAWLTHVIVCIETGQWGFLIAGALVFPIAVVHGIGIWFGAW